MVNFGAIGAIIGHEMIHGYDDQGSRFRASGNFEMGWTEADVKGFATRTDQLVAQFDRLSDATGNECQRPS